MKQLELTSNLGMSYELEKCAVLKWYREDFHPRDKLQNLLEQPLLKAQQKTTKVCRRKFLALLRNDCDWKQSIREITHKELWVNSLDRTVQNLANALEFVNHLNDQGDVKEYSMGHDDVSTHLADVVNFFET